MAHAESAEECQKPGMERQARSQINHHKKLTYTFERKVSYWHFQSKQSHLKDTW